jgi:hypothetical protein
MTRESISPRPANAAPPSEPRLGRRSVLALAVFAVVAALVIAVRWYEAHRTAPGAASGTLIVNVTSGADRGPGTLREALFVVATASGAARIVLEAPRIDLETALPPIVNAHGVTVTAQAGHGLIDAHRLGGGPVFDVAAPNITLDAVSVSRCPAAAILVRSARFHMHAATVTGCDVGVDVASNATDLLIERNRFADDRIGIRFAAASRDSSVVGNEFATPASGRCAASPISRVPRSRCATITSIMITRASSPATFRY